MNNFQSQTILVVDDEEAILKLLSRALERKGYKVDIANNGEEAIKKINSNDYGWIITDIKMPGVSGHEVCTQAKKMKGSAIYVIGISGTPWLLNDEKFDGIIAKPCSMKDLFETIDKVVPTF